MYTCACLDPHCAFADCAECSVAFPIASLQFWAAENFFILRENCASQIELRFGLEKDEEQNLRGSPCGFSKAETMMFVSRTTRIIAWGRWRDVLVVRHQSPRRSRPWRAYPD